jgi:uncharacterized protein
VRKLYTSCKKKPAWELQNRLVAAMMEPSFYPKPPAEITHKETHISHLFFVGDLVYKIKKAVRFSFLDYSTLAKRRHFLNEELQLNRRLAPSVYLGVMPITMDGNVWKLGGEEAPVEYVLVMRRLPDRRMLPVLLETQQATPKMMIELAELLARFHSQAKRVSPIDPSHYVEDMKKQWNENLTDLEPFLGNGVDIETFSVLKDFGAEFIQRHRDLLMRRVEEGWIRDVHGDLHCEHVCFAPEGIQIFDCIEFSAGLRCCDLASEIAFLLMDLDFRGAKQLGEAFLERYLELMGDRELLQLLPLYKSYRALVRGKVAALRSQGASDVASRYFRLAARYAWDPMKPFLVILCGVTGSGKSTLARQLAERLGMPVINSDTVRKSLAGVSGRQHVAYENGIYSRIMTKKTYAKMAREAEKLLKSGTGAILDATFSQRNNRQRIARLCDKYGVPLTVMCCRASDETTRARLAQRAVEGHDTSDGRWEIYIEQKKTFEAPSEIPTDDYLELDTRLPVHTLITICETFLRSRLANKQS